MPIIEVVWLAPINFHIHEKQLQKSTSREQGRLATIRQGVSGVGGVLGGQAGFDFSTSTASISSFSSLPVSMASTSRLRRAGSALSDCVAGGADVFVFVDGFLS